MEHYNVTGMSCAACQARVEQAVSKVDGVKSCAVSLLTNSMGVEGSASSADIIKAVEDAGYGASLKNASKSGGQMDGLKESLEDKETPKMKKRLITSVILLIPLMYVSMGHMLFNWPLPGFLDGNHVAMGIYELLIAGMIMVVNQKFFINGFKGIINRSPNMDTLVALGSTASYVYSIFALFMMTQAVLNNDADGISYYMDQFYFESAAMILTLITVGKTLESRSKGKTTNALKALLELAPKSAVILENGTEKTVPVEEVKVGDRFVVRPGDDVPVDGIVREGFSAVNESALTGESVPVDKQPGDTVCAATINTSGYMVCEATKVGEDTTLSEIIRMVSDAAATKAPIAKIADRVSGVFVPAVISVAFVTFIIWLLAGQSFGYAVARAVSVLVISCPCSLGLATPVAIMVGNGVGARSGILFKTAAALEQTGKTQLIALDKTGTVTTGIMEVSDVIPFGSTSYEELLSAAYALELKSEHPISNAITKYSEANGIEKLDVSDFEILPGNGLKGLIGNDKISGGNFEFIMNTASGSGSSGYNVSDKKVIVEKYASEGKTPVLFSRNNIILGLIAVCDTIKEDSKEAVSQLKNMGIHVVMLTGDNEITAKAVAAEAGVDEVVSSVKPDGKEAVIAELAKHGAVMMVGDGINDAPALTRADTGVAIGAGTDIAIDAADVVLMKSSIMDVAAAIRVSRATLKNIHENLFWAFFYNIIGIPLAAGCFVKAFGWTLNPMIGAAAMGLSSFCVVSNALRLNLVKPYDAGKDKKGGHTLSGSVLNKENTVSSNETAYIETDNNDESKESEVGNMMKVTVKGMMCEHCEAHVKKALEAIDGVNSALASHNDNLVTIETSKAVDETLIKKAVEDAGYEYCGIAE